MITGHTRLLAVLGDPVHHSLSPLMHNAALAHAQVDACYVALPVPADHLGEVLSALWHTQWLGLNITIPHKQRVMQYVTDLTPAAQAIGAVNTLYRGASGWCGANTDGLGFVQPLAGWSGEMAVVLGYGGAARAVVWGLQQIGCTAIHVFSRQPQQPVMPPAQLHPWSDLPVYLPHADLVVNTTPLGMTPDVAASPLTPEQLQTLPAGAWVYDLIYTPRPTQLLRWAAALGYPTQDGLAMLVGQGAAAWEYWFQRAAPLSVMTASLEQYFQESLQPMSASAVAGPTSETQG
ncbi:MAG: shikimate dehydrogenase [Gloeomargarita sp. SKYG116]|nr:shikimate dehydrogenase [Gloeomargarita sp. SKYG116]MCS7293547.1 shikimate dehydrogenase [Gloeomargarita sp. SKYB120]MDW8179113.1 shikimate dehydrogenase [Gloeomargarita sp. SKYBB_i_bin120]MDW8401211.1 shikimate dehydrogenase [Gloeomargarita sp. SKYGB_i_bin116]